LSGPEGVSPEQLQVCQRYGVAPYPSPPELKLGIARSVREGVLPINGLRHPPEGDTTGWYIWAGEELSEDEDFFVPIHVRHLRDWCPEAFPYLALPPGWRFQIAPRHEEVWEDRSLLDV
jgi:hypothetical protein